MKLSQLLEGVRVLKLQQSQYGQRLLTQDLDIRMLQYDSRAVERGDCFVAIRGTNVDGHCYIQQAVAAGALAVVMEDDASVPDPFFIHANVTKIVVGDSRRALATMSANIFGHPSKELTLVGITGTNGKTTTAYLVDSVLRSAGFTTGLVGTIQYRIGQQALPAPHTTPESLDLHRLFRRMRDAGVGAVSMEVSSHALDQARVYGIRFNTAVFTNLSQDHLDYHGTMERYLEAKKALFDTLDTSAWAVINSDDPAASRIISSSRGRVLTYGTSREARVHASQVQTTLEGTTVHVEYEGSSVVIHSPLVGRFNVHNLLAGFTAGASLSLPAEVISRGLTTVTAVPGRFERILSPKGWTAIIDYAHTPDALEKCLRAVRELMTASPTGRLITVFGAGGDRDRTKRPLMGAIAAEFSDRIVITSDNPRTEDPGAILDDIAGGIRTRIPVTREPDRRNAIVRTLAEARRGDVIVIAGKGHETVQIIGTERRHFNDREVVEEYV